MFQLQDLPTCCLLCLEFLFHMSIWLTPSLCLLNCHFIRGPSLAPVCNCFPSLLIVQSCLFFFLTLNTSWHIHMTCLFPYLPCLLQSPNCRIKNRC